MSLGSRVHHRFTVNEYDEMIARGILNENDRVELIRGEIVDKMPIGPRHAACVKRLNALFQLLYRGRWTVSVQDPIAFDDSKPEPDIALLRPRDDYYSEGTPQPSDILLVIEVADSSLDFDRDTKAALYAEAGIPEYWIVNLIDNCVEVHRGPKADGSYADCQRVSKGGAISLLGEEIAVDQLL